MRVVCFGSVEQQVDGYLATNVLKAVMSNEETMEVSQDTPVVIRREFNFVQQRAVTCLEMYTFMLALLF